MILQVSSKRHLFFVKKSVKNDSSDNIIVFYLSIEKVLLLYGTTMDDVLHKQMWIVNR